MQPKTMQPKTVIIPLPNGGHALVLKDELSNTVSVTAHDGSTVERVASDPQSLALLARVAAYDERSIEDLGKRYPDVEVLHQLPRLSVQRVDRCLEDFVDDIALIDRGDSRPTTLVEFREYHRALHAQARDDASWPEYWASIEEHVLRMALETARTRHG